MSTGGIIRPDKAMRKLCRDRTIHKKLATSKEALSYVVPSYPERLSGSSTKVLPLSGWIKELLYLARALDIAKQISKKE